MRVTVYLNEGPGRFFKFDPAEARLLLAAAFELDPKDWPVEHLLSHIYEQLNVGGDMVEATEWTERYRANRNRSLSVGDVVVLGETAWAVASFGFDRITTEALQGAME